ncbi:IS110 family transposase [Acididesulfobacillus acetoxydans]|nr:IS110 family transposase [Acididesulfobacillus acetoxydans]
MEREDNTSTKRNGAANRPLSDANITSHILNPLHAKAIPGKKTDQTDAQRIAYLSMHNLVRPSYIPEPIIMNLRLLTRQRWAVVSSLRRTKNTITRTLDECNIKFSLVATDLFGVSGRLVLTALLKEQAPDPFLLANFAKGKLRKKIPLLCEALTGHLSDEHRFILGLLLDDLSHIEQELLLLDARINAYVSVHGLLPWLNILLSIPGVKRLSAINILAEIGTDLSSFPDTAHFASWIALCPGNNISAGKAKSAAIRKANRYLRSALVQVAWAVPARRTLPWRITSSP